MVIRFCKLCARYLLKEKVDKGSNANKLKKIRKRDLLEKMMHYIYINIIEMATNNWATLQNLRLMPQRF